VVTIVGCSSLAKNPLTYEKNSIVFGEGGGFRGIETSTMILENGQVFELEKMRTKYESKKSLSRQDAEQLFSIYNTLGLAEIEVNSPGNTYSYIEFHHNKTIKRLVWKSNEAPSEVLILHRILNKLVQ